MAFRQGGGSSGGPRRGGVQTVQVGTNCFEITRVPNKTYYLYDVSITPEEKVVRKREAILHRLQTVVDPLVFSTKALYDGKALLYSTQLLQLGGGGSQTYTVSLRGDQSNQEGRAGVYSVKITRTSGAPLRPEDFRNLTGTTGLNPRLSETLNLLQLLLTSGAHQKYPHRKTSFFVETNKEQLGRGLELWRGFFQSVRPTVKQLLVNVDTTMSPVYRAGSLIDVALEVLGAKDVRALVLNNGDRDLHTLEVFFKGLQITTMNMPSKTRFIHSLIVRGGQYTFEKDGEEITVEKYMFDAYNIRLKYPTIIGVVVSRKNAMNRTVLPAELCSIKPGQLYKKALTREMTARAVKFSALPPAQRQKELLQNKDSPLKNYTSSEAIYESGLQVNTTPVAISGKLLQPPALQFKDAHLPLSPSDRNPGSWNVMRQKLLEPAHLKLWIVVTFVQSNSSAPLGMLMSCMQDLGMTVDRYQRVVPANGQGDISKQLDKAVLDTAKTGNFAPEKLQLVLVILPNEAEHIRNQAKHWGDCSRGVVTQCLRIGKLERANNQYGNNVALKINARLGGCNSLAKSVVLEDLWKEPFIIFGADVSHAPPNSIKPSVASIVWSMDPKGVRYAALTRLQHPRAEIISDLAEMVAMAVTAFGETLRCSPRKIFFYRDGVSEGEFSKVAQFEIPAIEAGIKQAYQKANVKDPFPKLTFIVVGKRHHITFYPPADQTINDGKGNCRPGFVTAEGELENPAVKDFYLNSHAAIQGTSRSAHYTVLRDDIYNYDLHKLQSLSYDLCHIYAKATRSVSITTPVYYADLACARGSFHFTPGTENSDTASNSTDRSWTDSDMQRFESAFQPAKLRKMYFL